MMIDFLKYKIFLKFLGLIMRFHPKARPLELQSLHLNWRLSHWSCSPTFIHCLTSDSSILEEHSSYVVLKGVRPPKDGKISVCLCPISLVSLQASKSHSSKVPKSESFPHATSAGHGSATHTTFVHTETTSPHTLKVQMTSTQHVHPSSQAERLSTLIEGLH